MRFNYFYILFLSHLLFLSCTHISNTKNFETVASHLNKQLLSSLVHVEGAGYEVFKSLIDKKNVNSEYGLSVENKNFIIHLLEKHPFFYEIKTNFKNIKFVRFEIIEDHSKKNTLIPYGKIRYDFILDELGLTSFYVDWILLNVAWDKQFQSQINPSNFGFFTIRDENNKQDLIEKFSMTSFPLSITVVGSSIPDVFKEALDQSIKNWNLKFKKNFKNGLFKDPFYQTDLNASGPFLGEGHGVFIDLNFKKGFDYSGHTINHVNQLTGEIYGSRMWLNLDRLVKSGENILKRCRLSQMNEVYSEPWESLGDCKQSSKKLTIGSIRYMLTHELGHVLGLSHNLKGSIQFNKSEISSSIMEYPHRALRPQMKLGDYDQNAILAGYFDLKTDKIFPFCKDDQGDIWDEKFQIKDPYCNGYDQGPDPFKYYLKSWKKLIKLGHQKKPKYKFEELKPGIKLALKFFSQYYINFPNKQKIILDLLNQNLCVSMKNKDQKFIEDTQKLVIEVFNSYSGLKTQFLCF